MGTGTDVAIESATITLVKGDLQGIVKAKNLSTAVMKNIKQNLFFALIYNTLGVPIAAGVLFPFFGILLSPMIAALAMSFSSVSVIVKFTEIKRNENIVLPSHRTITAYVVSPLTMPTPFTTYYGAAAIFNCHTFCVGVCHRSQHIAFYT
ncbi:MAG: hypothetical protein R2806_24485 [Saprospiraceae bacterium]